MKKNRECSIEGQKLARGGHRDNYIDLLRGIAAINIIFIHTAFWSGDLYVPEIVQSLSLIIDVPFFFFLSGVAISYTRSFWKTVESVLKIYKEWLIFLLFYVFLLFVLGKYGENGFTLDNLYGHLFFYQKEQTILPVVLGSTWFLTVYIVVMPISGLLIYLANKAANGDEQQFNKYCKTILLISAIELLYAYFKGGEVRTVFYIFIVFLGVVCRKLRIKRVATLIALVCFDVLCMKLLGMYFGWDISNMQNMKIQHNIVYFLYSLVAIICALWGRSKIQVTEKNIFCRMGKSAIYFYFAQGLSSSLIYHFIPQLNLHWLPKITIAFVANVVLAVFFVAVLKGIYCFAGKVENIVIGKISCMMEKSNECV